MGGGSAKLDAPIHGGGGRLDRSLEGIGPLIESRQLGEQCRELVLTNGRVYLSSNLVPIEGLDFSDMTELEPRHLGQVLGERFVRIDQRG